MVYKATVICRLSPFFTTFNCTPAAVLAKSIIFNVLFIIFNTYLINITRQTLLLDISQIVSVTNN